MKNNIEYSLQNCFIKNNNLIAILRNKNIEHVDIFITYLTLVKNRDYQISFFIIDLDYRKTLLIKTNHKKNQYSVLI